VLLALSATIAGSQGGNEPDFLAFVIALAPLAILVLFLFFAIRWQVRLFKDLQDSLHRIADAVERIASRR
jgi:Kef-type K+ transport system membrane component KefB